MTAVDHNGPTGLSDSIQNNSATVDTLKNSTNNNLTNNNNNNNNASVKNAFQRSKKTYLEEEEQLERIVYHNNNLFSQHFQNFLDKTIASLDIQFEKCETLLQELQQQSNLNNTTNHNNNNTYWNSKTIIEHCNLHMSEKRLIRYQLAKHNNNNHAEVPLGIEDAPKSGVNPNNNNNNTNENEVTSLSKLIQLISVIEKIRSTSFATPKQKAFLDRCVEKLRVVHYEPRDFLSIVNALQVKLQDDGKTKTVFTDLTNFQNNIENLTPEIQKCENLLEMSIKNGEMGLAESISKRQLELYEHTLSLITEQYPTLHQHFEERKMFDRRRRWSIFRMADKDISSVMENKYKLIEACEEDIEKIQEQVENYAKDDQFQRRRYEMDKQQSDEFLQQNKEKQQSVWNRVFELLKEFQNCEAELVTLSRERKKEVERRLVVEERESSRRGGQGAFLAAAEEHAQNLLETVENAESARALAEELNAFILDNCASIAEKYDRQQQTLADMLRVVQQYHFQKFSDYYVSAHRFLYRKTRQVERIKEQMTANTMKREIYVETLDPNAKKYADENEKLLMQRRELEEEIHSLRSRIDKAEQQVEPTLRALDFANVSYVHPREVVEKMVLTRWETMLRYKEELSSNVVEGEPGVAAIVSKKEHEEEIQTIQALRSTLQRSKKENNTNNNNAQQQMTAPPATATTSDSLVPRPPQSAFAKRVQSFLERQLSVRDEGEEDTKDTDAAGRLHKTYPQKAAAVTPHGIAATVDGAAATLNNNNNKVVEGSIFKALYPYQARAADELTFAEGDLIICLSRAKEEGWLRGMCNQRAGLFPVNYVVMQEDTELLDQD